MIFPITLRDSFIIICRPLQFSHHRFSGFRTFFFRISFNLNEGRPFGNSRATQSPVSRGSRSVFQWTEFSLFLASTKSVRFTRMNFSPKISASLSFLMTSSVVNQFAARTRCKGVGLERFWAQPKLGPVRITFLWEKAKRTNFLWPLL